MALRPPPSARTIDERREFGVVNLDKPPGPISHQVSSWVRELLDAEKAAHAGTLDPKVTGCLPVLVGTATRLVPALLSAEKEYVVVLELHGPAPADTSRIVGEFEDEIYQKPPRKSAVARRLRTRRVTALEVLELERRRALLRVRCESGTYVRKLCHDLGLALGTGAHMGDLRRTASGPFDDASLVSLHDVADAVAAAEAGDDDPLLGVLAPGERALTHLPRVIIARNAAEAVATGAPVYAPGVLDVEPEGLQPDGQLVACYTGDGSVVCVGTLVGDPTAGEGMVVDLERVLV